MKIKNESEILNIEVRQQIIAEINAPENQKRKDEAFKRYQCFKDQTDQYVLEQLSKQFDQDTINEMTYSIANISLVKKVISKLARVYNSGVRREVEDDKESTQRIETLAKELELNTELRKTNLYLKLQRNMALYIKPCPETEENGLTYFDIDLNPLQPYLYDVVNDHYNPKSVKAFILSDYSPRAVQYTARDAATVNRTTQTSPSVSQLPNGKNEQIADQDDEKKGEMIWWTKNFHFTTNLKGEIISQEIENPIKRIPAVFYAIDQDGQFWAQGGDDLIDGAILINSVLTHNQHIAVTQGYGQFFMKGKNLPRNAKIGPNKAILMEYEEGDPEPSIGFANASPDIAGLRSLVEQYVALLLSTNNLSTSSVSATLGANNSAPSGIAMILDKSESMEDVNDQRQLFVDKEGDIFEIVNEWLKIYGQNLDETLIGLELPDDISDKLQITFLDAPVIVSESEKLDNIKKRKDLGINTQKELIQLDNPSLTKKQIEKKMKELMDEFPSRKQSSNDQNNLNDQEKTTEQVDLNVQKTALNGAQVTSMVDVVSKVALGLLPREAGVQILYQAFNLEESEASRIMGNAGAGFTVEDRNNESNQSRSNGQQDSVNSGPNSGTQGAKQS